MAIRCFSSNTFHFLTPSLPPKPGRLRPLDGLRGLAALLVFFEHFTRLFSSYPTEYGAGGLWFEIPLAVLSNGATAVALFFVLSGYVLTHSVLSAPDRSIARAVLARWPRLIPLVLLSVVLAWVVIRMQWAPILQTAAMTHSSWVGRIQANALVQWPVWSLSDALVKGVVLTFFRTDVLPFANPSLWTLKTELLGSFMVYGIVAVMRLSPPREVRVALGIIAVLCLFNDPHLCLFVLGAWLAHHHHQVAPSTSNASAYTKFKPLLTGVALGLCLVVLAFHNPVVGVFPVGEIFRNSGSIKGILLNGAMSVLLIHVCMQANWLGRGLSHPALTHLGNISFAFYVLHFPLLLSVGAAVFLALYSLSNHTFAIAGALITTIGVTLLLSAWATKLDGHWRRFLRP